MTMVLTKLASVSAALTPALQVLNILPRVRRDIARNPVVVEVRLSLRRIGLVRKLWRLDRADAAAAKAVAYERAFLKSMERGFDEQLQANRDKRYQLRLALLNLDGEDLQ